MREGELVPEAGLLDEPGALPEVDGGRVGGQGPDLDLARAPHPGVLATGGQQLGPDALPSRGGGDQQAQQPDHVGVARNGELAVQAGCTSIHGTARP